MSEPIILFEDEFLVVIVKPAGVVVNEAESVRGGTVQKWFENKFLKQNSQNNLELRDLNLEFYQKGGVVHRLDKDTSGVMVLAKTENAYQALKSQFLERRVLKNYLALVHGQMRETEGLISLPVERHPVDRKKFTVGGDLSRTAITKWKSVAVYKNPANAGEIVQFLELEPHTGRTHQLRVHLKHFQHPIVSDPIYGNRKQLTQDLSWCPRLFLHAYKLNFKHPITGREMEISSDLPQELDEVLKRLVVEEG